MAPKNKEAVPPEMGTPATKKTHWKATEEKSGEVTTRLEQLGIAHRDREEMDPDPDNRSKEQLRQEWVKTLAQHLAREPRFLRITETTPDPSDIIVAKNWIASVHLDRRYKIYAKFHDFESQLLNTSRQFEQDIVARATEILDNSIGRVQTSMEKTTLPPPPEGAASDSLREATFFYQILRGRIINAVKASTDHELLLFRKIISVDPGDFKGGRDKKTTAVNELVLLEKTKEELRGLLNKTTSAEVGKKVLNGLLAGVAESSRNLFELPVETVENGLGKTRSTSAPPGSVGLSIQDKILKIDAKHPFTPFFYDPDISGKDDVVAVASRPETYSVDRSVHALTGAQIEKLSQIGNLDDLDKTVSGALEASSTDINVGKFRANLQEFEAIVDRPSMCKLPGFDDRDHVRNGYALLDLVSDNLFHVKVLAAQLRQHQLLQDSTADGEFQACLRRMWALVAIMYGCAPEGCLWLTTMDSLLEDLAHKVRGQADPRLGAAKIQRFRKMQQNKADPTKIRPLSPTELEELEKDDLARRIFAELAQFYRGAVILAYSSVSWKPKVNSERGANWYKILLQWSTVCAGDTCTKALAVREVPTKGGKTGKEGQVDGNAMERDEVGSATTAQRDIIAKSRFGISTVILGSRSGFEEEKSEISEIRSIAYPGLYHLIRGNTRHAGFGPFFHHFAHPYHPLCQPARGKLALTMTMESALTGGKEKS